MNKQSKNKNAAIKRRFKVLFFVKLSQLADAYAGIK